MLPLNFLYRTYIIRIGLGGANRCGELTINRAALVILVAAQASLCISIMVSIYTKA